MFRPRALMIMAAALLIVAVIAATGLHLVERARPASYHYARGLELDRRGESRHAEREFRAAITEDPTNADARVALAVTLLNLKQYGEAETTCREVLKADPRHTVARIFLGHALRSQNRADEAIAVLREGVELEPNKAQIREHLGFALMSAGKLDDAVAEARRCVEMEPQRTGARMLLAHALHRKGELDEAVAVAREEAAGGNPAGRHLLVRLCYEKGDYATAWREVHWLERYHLLYSEEDQQLVADLRAKMPEPDG